MRPSGLPDGRSGTFRPGFRRPDRPATSRSERPAHPAWEAAPIAPTGSQKRCPDSPRGEHSMPLQVIGAGLGRTGTLSLKVALEQLGFDKCYHMVEVLAHPEHVRVWDAAARGEPVDWEALFRGY